jgi:serine/threonine-protein kinase PpkA
VEEAKYSTHAFTEDSMAGLNAAIEDLDWEGYDSRVIILITDAGPLRLDDPFNYTTHTPSTLESLARSKNIKIMTLHLLTYAGRRNHRSAESAYRNLSSTFDGQNMYMEIPAYSIEESASNLWNAINWMSKGLEYEFFDQVKQSTDDDEFKLAWDEVTDSDDSQVVGEPQIDSQSSEESRAARKASLEEKRLERAKAKAGGANSQKVIGQAINFGKLMGFSSKLEYLGDVNQARAPRVVRSWIAEKDLGRLDSSHDERPTVEVAVLLTKNQLSALRTQLKIILEEADKALDTQSKDFFQSILSASARISRDANQFTLSPTTRLGDMGVMGEFLSDLPYKSLIMDMTEQDWYNMSPIEQDNFVRMINSRVKAYEKYDQESDGWAKYDPYNDSEWLYRVPLVLLP